MSRAAWRTAVIDTSGTGYVENAIHLTQGRRRLLSDLIGIRQRRGLTQAQVAAAVGVRARTVRRFEDRPDGAMSFDFILRYAHAVGASITMLCAPSIHLPLPGNGETDVH